MISDDVAENSDNIAENSDNIDSAIVSLSEDVAKEVNDLKVLSVLYSKYFTFLKLGNSNIHISYILSK